MKPAIRFAILYLLFISMLPWSAAHASSEATDDKDPVPYEASVRISGVIADVLVTQLYKNEGKKSLEAVYVFPASTRAAVYGMKMTIGKRVIEAKIKKRDEARRDYEQARDQGRSASLLEQQRPNVFQMNVANIMPDNEIKVVMRYTELIVPTDRVYEFIYPSVVGPRYSNQKAETATPSEHWVHNPYLRQGKAPTTRPDGTVKGVQLLSSNLKSKASPCMADQIKKIRLPATPDGKEGRVVITLTA